MFRFYSFHLFKEVFDGTFVQCFRAVAEKSKHVEGGKDRIRHRIQTVPQNPSQVPRIDGFDEKDLRLDERLQGLGRSGDLTIIRVGRLSRVTIIGIIRGVPRIPTFFDFCSRSQKEQGKENQDFHLDLLLLL